MVIFHSYVSLPEGIPKPWCSRELRRNLGGWDSSDMMGVVFFFNGIFYGTLYGRFVMAYFMEINGISWDRREIYLSS